MLAALVKPFRRFMIALALVCCSISTTFAEPSSRHQPAPAQNHDAQRDPPRGDPVIGLLIIAGVVALLVLMAWVATRIGDVDRPSDKVPN